MKKLICMVLAAVILSMGCSTAFAVTVPGAVYSDQQAVGSNKPAVKVAEELEKAGVKDVQADHWAAGSITVLLQSGLLRPDSNGDFRPDANVSGAEGIAVFAKVLGIASKTDSDEEAMAKMKDTGLIDYGTPGDRDMTRIEVARMLAKALGIKPFGDVYDSPFVDTADISYEDRGILRALYEMGIFKGYEDHTFRPDSVLTRAQIAILIDRILG